MFQRSVERYKGELYKEPDTVRATWEEQTKVCLLYVCVCVCVCTWHSQSNLRSDLKCVENHSLPKGSCQRATCHYWSPVFAFRGFSTDSRFVCRMTSFYSPVCIILQSVCRIYSRSVDFSTVCRIIMIETVDFCGMSHTCLWMSVKYCQIIYGVYGG